MSPLISAMNVNAGSLPDEADQLARAGILGRCDNFRPVARRIKRSWTQRIGVAFAVLLIQALILGGLLSIEYIKAPPPPGVLTVTNVASQPVQDEPPAPQQPKPVTLIPIEVPIEINVASETAITVLPPAPPSPPPPRQPDMQGDPTLKNYQIALLRHLDAHKRYPASARSKRNQGIVLVRFVMDRTGRVLSTSLVRTSSFTLLDDEGVALPLRASPLPAPPPQLPGDPISLVVPVEYFLH